MVTIDRDIMTVHFKQFGIECYELFKKCKRLPESTIEFVPEDESYKISAPARFAPMIGVETPVTRALPLPLPDFLLEDQREIVPIAIEAKRFAVWSGCGNGKTVIGLEYARQVCHITGGRTLIVTRNEIVPQWNDEARKFYGDALPITGLESRAAMREWMQHGPAGTIAITNYEKWNPESLDDQIVNEARLLACIILDESSRLKGGGGKQKWALIKSCRGIEYKLTLTATPAPNDTIEFASQASFLEKMRTDKDIIWTFFARDPKTHRWTVKPHARQAFFEFMSSWSIYVNNPKRFGWRLNLPDVPQPEYHTIEIEPTEQQMKLLRVMTADAATGQMNLLGGKETNAIQRLKLSQIAKGFRYEQDPDGRRRVKRIESRKPAAVADIIRKEADRGASVLVWTVFDAESAILGKLLKDLGDVDVLTGSTGKPERAAMLDRFRAGESRVLISRARMLGYGMNLQAATAMVFSGWTDSFEDLYQAVRRAVRYGQTEAVRVYFPVITELEGDMLANIRRKEVEFERSIEEMEANYIRAYPALKGSAA